MSDNTNAEQRIETERQVRRERVSSQSREDAGAMVAMSGRLVAKPTPSDVARLNAARAGDPGTTRPQGGR